jgi:hypothetical protein
MLERHRPCTPQAGAKNSLSDAAGKDATRDRLRFQIQWRYELTPPAASPGLSGMLLAMEALREMPVIVTGHDDGVIGMWNMWSGGALRILQPGKKGLLSHRNLLDTPTAVRRGPVASFPVKSDGSLRNTTTTTSTSEDKRTPTIPSSEDQITGCCLLDCCSAFISPSSTSSSTCDDGQLVALFPNWRGGLAVVRVDVVGARHALFDHIGAGVLDAEQRGRRVLEHCSACFMRLAQAVADEADGRESIIDRQLADLLLSVTMMTHSPHDGHVQS